MLQKNFVYYKDYASATIENILSAKQIKESVILKCFVLETGWWENKDNQFIFHALPLQAQTSPVESAIIYDFNHDGNPDLLMAGNKYSMEVETGRLDAGIGIYLQGDGKGKFTWVNNMSSGFWAPMEVRDLALLKGPDKKLKVIVANNNTFAQVFETSD